MLLQEKLKSIYFTLLIKFKEFRISFWEKFDRTISGSIIQQLKCYAWIVAGFLSVFILISLFLGHGFKEQNSTLGAVSGVMHYFFHGGEWFKEDGFLASTFATVVSIVGMLVFTGLFIASVSNSIRERVDNIKDGRIVYKNISDHYIIIGYGEITISLIENIFEKNYTLHNNNNTFDIKSLPEAEQKKFTFPKIILLTNQDIPTVRAKIYSYFPKFLEEKIYFYAGNIESSENISNTNIHLAKEVYVLGEQNEDGRDIKNLEAINRISSLRGDKSSGHLKVYMQFDRLTSYSIIQKLPILKEYLCSDCASDMNTFFRPFNFYENTARLLWGYTGADSKYEHLDFEPIEGDKYVHLMIIGFNRMGRALLFEALRLCHYPNYVEENIAKNIKAKNKTKITIVDNTISAQLPTFLAEYPYLDQIKDIDIEFMPYDAGSKEVRSLLSQESVNDNALLTVAVCLQDPDYSMSVGLSLPHEVYYKVVGKEVQNSNTHVLIRQEVQEGLSSIVNNNDTKFKNVHVFGGLMTGMNEKLLCDDMPMCVNAYYDTKYMQLEEINGKQVVHENHAPKKAALQEYYDYVMTKLEHGQKFKDKTFIDWVTDAKHNKEMMRIAENLWSNLTEDFRFSNRYQVDMYGTYLRYQGNSKLAQMEHLRWNADRSIIGYRDMSGESIKDVAFHLHNLIIPFNCLDKGKKEQKEVEKDEDVIANMSKLIKYFDPKTAKQYKL